MSALVALFGLCALMVMPRAALAADLYLLAIGIGDYQDKRIPELKYTDDDVNALRIWAEGQRGHYYHQTHVKTLLNAQATRPDIVQALLEYYQGAQPEDLLVLYLSGHGVVDAASGSWNFLPVEADFDNIAGTGLDQDELLRKLIRGTRD